MIPSDIKYPLLRQPAGARAWRLLLAAMPVLLLIPATLAAQTASIAPGLPQTIVLEPQTLTFTPTEYWIAEVQDEREIRTAVAWLLPAAPDPKGGSPQPVDLQGGGHTAITRFVQHSLPATKNLRPVIVRLQECRITETPGEAGKVDGRLALRLQFDLQTDRGPVELTSYAGGLRYSRDARHHKVVAPALQQALARSLEYFNEWMQEQAPHNEKLAKGVRIFFAEHAPDSTPDTVYYSPLRPLRWDDFKASPGRSSRFAASVFPTFAYSGSSQVVGGYIHLTLRMQVYVLMENSWVKQSARDAYGLNHEQRHFDLVKLVSERFKQHLQAQSYPVADYSGLIATQYLDFFREMNKVQEAYDRETAHGLNRTAQERWNSKIDAELRSFGIIQ